MKQHRQHITNSRRRQNTEGQAIHVLDRFHIMGHFGKAIDEARTQEARELRARGREPVLTKTRWLLLKRPEHLTEKQEVRLADLLRRVALCLYHTLGALPEPKFTHRF